MEVYMSIAPCAAHLLAEMHHGFTISGHALAMEGGLNHPALAQVEIFFAGEQAIAQNELEEEVVPVLVEIAVPRYKAFLRNLGAIGEVDVQPREIQPHDIAIGLMEPQDGGDTIFRPAAHETKRTQQAWAGNGRRRNAGLGKGRAFAGHGAGHSCTYGAR
jgi:hypothetical protein